MKHDAVQISITSGHGLAARVRYWARRPSRESHTVRGVFERKGGGEISEKPCGGVG